MESICIIDGCEEPRYPGRARCLQHHRDDRRAYDRLRRIRKNSHVEFGRLVTAIELTAAYFSGYRNGVGDRAIQLAQEMRRLPREDEDPRTTYAYDRLRESVSPTRLKDGLTIRAR